MKKPDGMSQELYELILNSESMDNWEKKYWFDIFPSMFGEQRQRLFNILERKKVELEELNKKYER